MKSKDKSRDEWENELEMRRDEWEDEKDEWDVEMNGWCMGGWGEMNGRIRGMNLKKRRVEWGGEREDERDEWIIRIGG